MQQSGDPGRLLEALQESSTRNWALFCHLAAFFSFVVPFGHLIGPVAVWMAKRNESPFIDWHGREAVNFQITSTIVGGVLAVALVVTLVSGGLFADRQDPAALGSVLLPVIGEIIALAAWGLTSFILVLVAGVRASRGERWQYPLCIRFLS